MAHPTLRKSSNNRPFKSIYSSKRSLNQGSMLPPARMSITFPLIPRPSLCKLNRLLRSSPNPQINLATSSKPVTKCIKLSLTEWMVEQ